MSPFTSPPPSVGRRSTTALRRRRVTPRCVSALPQRSGHRPILRSRRRSSSAPMAGRHRVLIIGGGFGGLRAARALKSAPVDVTLIDREWAIEDLTFSRGARLITGPALTDFDCNKEMAGGRTADAEPPDGRDIQGHR